METSRFEIAQSTLQKSPKTWLVTGGAGFIGSNIVEALLKLDQQVVVLDNYSTGHQRNQIAIQKGVKANQWERCKWLSGDIQNLETCQSAANGVDFVLHQAALGSVPRSIEDPIRTNNSNVSGFLNMLVASRDARVKTFVYAASSSTYGDHPALPKVEENIGKPLSPYAVTKYVNELYADVFARTYQFSSIGLRYFNVFGPRQDPNGPYAAVIPKWIDAFLKDQPIKINGDGQTSRDFCYVDNVVQANILAALAPEEGMNHVYNVAVGESTSLLQLAETLKSLLAKPDASIVHGDFRSGDVRHSLADISKAARLLGYKPSDTFQQGIEKTVAWWRDKKG